jgi:hypothetical protein
MRFPFSLHPHQHLLLVLFLMIAILTRVRWNLSVVLICISFMARDDEHFFMFLAIWTSSFEKVLLVQLPILYWLIDFGGIQFFELPALFWLSVLCLMYS